MRIKASEEADCTEELIAWLQSSLDLIRAGRPLQANPFYERNVELTPEVVDKAIEDIEECFRYEIEHFHVSHSGWQGVPAELLRPTGFDKEPYPVRRAIVQGIDRICQSHRMTDVDFASEQAAKEAEEIRLAAVLVERAANLAVNPHFYDYEYCAEYYGC